MPSGSFTMGTDDASASGVASRPAHRVQVPRFGQREKLQSESILRL